MKGGREGWMKGGREERMLLANERREGRIKEEDPECLPVGPSTLSLLSKLIRDYLAPQGPTPAPGS